MEIAERNSQLLKGWDVRTQLIWGTKDRVFVSWFVEKFEELLPNHAKSLRISTASHFLQDDEPEIIIDKIKEFLSEEFIKDKDGHRDKIKSGKSVSA